MVVGDKATRVASFHRATVENVTELLGVAGLDSLDELRPMHINRRVQGTEIKTYEQLYPRISPNCLLHAETVPADWRDDWNAADAQRW